MTVTLNDPWSGTFIVWVIKNGLGNDSFPANAAHSGYAQQIRAAANRYPFTVLNPRLVSPEVGDIIINWRSPSRPTSFNTPNWAGVLGHGDIVIEKHGSRLTVLGGNKSRAVTTGTVNLGSSGKLNSTFYAILRPFQSVASELYINLAKQELNAWVTQNLKDYSPGAVPYLRKYWQATGNQFVGAGNTPTIRYTPAQSVTPTGVAISPYIASIESFHPHIQYELVRRKIATETANTYYPFIKLTSLVNVLGQNLPSGKFGVPDAYCPSLGIHGQKQPIDLETILNPVETSGKSIIGYAIQEQASKGVYVPVIVDSIDEDPLNIPVPGIVSVSTERSTAGPMGVRGGLFRATINIRAHSLGQVNGLLKYFLRPATRVVLELGRESSSEYEQALSNAQEFQTLRNEGVEEGPKEVTQLFQKFNWERTKQEINAELEPLVRLEKGQRDFIQRYVYNNFGNYEIFIGYVVSFKLKYTNEGVYEIELLVHSVQQFEVPTKLSGAQPLTKVSVPDSCKTIELSDYFNFEAGNRPNSFIRLMTETVTSGTSLNASWGNHVIVLNRAGSDNKPAYLISWKFFVDVILNNEEMGLLSVFQLKPDSATMKTLRSAMLVPVTQNITTPTSINAYEVSYHPKLRSTDPSVMLIYSPTAQEARFPKSKGSDPVLNRQRDYLQSRYGSNLGSSQASGGPLDVASIVAGFTRTQNSARAIVQQTQQTLADSLNARANLNLRAADIPINPNLVTAIARSLPTTIPQPTMAGVFGHVRTDISPAPISEIKGATRALALTSPDIDNIRNGINDSNIFDAIRRNTAVGEFKPVAGGNSSAFLTNGVWINSNAIVDAFSGSDTISNALLRLLNQMNNATQGFWNLQILSTDAPIGRPGTYVIDMGLSKPNDQPVIPLGSINEEGGPIVYPLTDLSTTGKFKEAVTSFKSSNGGPKYLYSFNDKVSFEQGTNGGIGSELLDITIDSNLPQVIAVQAIAGVGGVAQRGSLNAIDIDELKTISLYDVYPKNTDQVSSTDVCTGTRTVSQAVDDQQFQILKDNAQTILSLIQNIANQKDDQTSQKYYEKQLDGLLSASLYRDVKSPHGLPYELDAEYRRYLNLPTPPPPTPELQAGLQRELEILRRIPAEVIESNSPGILGLTQTYAASFGQALVFIENDISKLIKDIDVDDIDRNNPTKVHPFNSSNLTKTTVDLKLPGVGGIQLFQSFSVSRAPNILNKGYYIVTKVSHDFSLDNGWTTNIEGRFRYKPDPNRVNI